MIRKKFKREIAIITVVVVICIILLYFFRKHDRQAEEILLNAGIETTGTITKKSYVSDEGHGYYYIWYSFQAGDSILNGYQILDGEPDHQNAIVGRKYKVRYLPGDPAKSRLYLDEIILE
jgi:hypothetical protein